MWVSVAQHCLASSNRSVPINRCTSLITTTHQSRFQPSRLTAAFGHSAATKSTSSASDPDGPIAGRNSVRNISFTGARSSNPKHDESTMFVSKINGVSHSLNGSAPKLHPKRDRWALDKGDQVERDYLEAIKDLNDLQSNNQVLALAKYKRPETILPLFSRQLKLADIDIADLDKLNAIHISGTKGKGSTCAFLESILLSSEAPDGKARKLKVGSYNSPHLIHVTERIKIDGQPISKALFTLYFREVFDKLKAAAKREQIAMPSYFAFLTILAFHTFLREQVDCALIEVGIGGEYDPTNIINRPVACAITTLDLDHTNILGHTIRDIAWTKAGIIKPGVPMFTVEHEQKEATEMICKRARQLCSPVYVCKPLRLEAVQSKLGIRGPAQTINASVACQLASHLLNQLRPPSRKPSLLDSGVTSLGTDLAKLPKSFASGLDSARLAGRCQIVENEHAIFFLDGAHTRKSMENCIGWFMEASPVLQQNSTKFLMVNVIGERNKCDVLQPLIPQAGLFDKVIFTSNQVYPTTELDDADEIETFVKAQDGLHEKGLENVKNNVRAWLELVKSSNTSDRLKAQLIVKSSIMESIDAATTAHSNEYDADHPKPHILATGSLHFVGAILDAIGRL